MAIWTPSRQAGRIPESEVHRRCGAERSREGECRVSSKGGLQTSTWQGAIDIEGADCRTHRQKRTLRVHNYTMHQIYNPAVEDLNGPYLHIKNAPDMKVCSPSTLQYVNTHTKIDKQHTQAHEDRRACRRTCTHTHTHTHLHACAHIHAHTRTHTQTRRYSHGAVAGKAHSDGVC